MTVRASHARALAHRALVLAFGFVRVYPLLWLLASSFKGAAAVFTHMTSLIPGRFTFDNYRNGWTGSRRSGSWAGNSGSPA